MDFAADSVSHNVHVFFFLADTLNGACKHLKNFCETSDINIDSAVENCKRKRQ